MKHKFPLIFILGVLVFGPLGCAVLNKPVKFVNEFVSHTFFPPYSGPKAKVIIADFEIMTAKATAEMSSNLRELLASGLLKSQHFQLAAPGKDNNEKPSGLIIATELLDFEPRGSGGSSGVGGGGSAASGALGSLLGANVNKSHITLNIRIVDAETSKVLFSKRVSGQGVEGHSLAKGKHKGSNLGSGLSMYGGTPMEEAVDKCILEAVRYIVQNVPPQYYKGENKNGKTQAQGKA
ncbi:MAG: hypothetical protein COT38_05880 [Candidatus Omnitrophica bacterium CG08_land_8_20_14_0_20_41_16]|uniref:Curli production assembly/transport component CsgG n=1 Tax=Candidatus Sherwoodlollariibacterium unditelluris TaxID=1974757 RepID=A0A2G9YK33_9BACT|nr:MAG: hypothetical protein COX41_02105 [Candidatus Omnitrophica bacterium CG23_combo_of_CG06-09_8_20_14_all_41_10]PIS33340.1 MAG: hypothetical protein COT38_05880 [Candidatus Omnitrophica bacterium CG08_land_8_20_14_0_20_41_16]